mmetsp:Transcript_17828/g.30241  ORF Transcript_17828/g.30241 Transcript_17828/m.30241 type:complete len:86 (+) Transcript_17828:3-260(+)
MTDLVDKKIQVLYDNYKDNLHAVNAQKEVESMRNRARFVGVGITTSVFVVNELFRIAYRSPLFKYSPLTLAAFIVAPTMLQRMST